MFLPLPHWAEQFGLSGQQMAELAKRIAVVRMHRREILQSLRAATTETDRERIVELLLKASETAGCVCYGLRYIGGMLEAQLARERRDNTPRKG